MPTKLPRTKMATSVLAIDSHWKDCWGGLFSTTAWIFCGVELVGWGLGAAGFWADTTGLRGAATLLVSAVGRGTGLAAGAAGTSGFLGFRLSTMALAVFTRPSRISFAWGSLPPSEAD